MITFEYHKIKMLDSNAFESTCANLNLLTNFDRKYLPIYEEAIKRYNHEEYFYICKEAFDIYGNRLSDNIMTLHYIGPNTDLSPSGESMNKSEMKRSLNKASFFFVL